MTAPRQIRPGTTYLITRRCAHREFLLRPSKVASQVLLYLLALGASRHGIKLHAFCVMSNHYHLVLTDPDARLPLFEQLLDGLAGRALNALLGRNEAFWGPDSFSAVELVGPEAVVDKAAYTLANPVAAGLVRSARRWPGPWSSPEDVGAEARQVERPTHFFAADGDLPVSVPLELTVPPGFASAEAFRRQLTSALASREAEAARKVGTFLGAARVLAQKTTTRASSREPLGELSPRVAAKGDRRRIEALARWKAFLSDYRAALHAWRNGERATVFPAGTYLMRVLCGVTCAGAG